MSETVEFLEDFVADTPEQEQAALETLRQLGPDYEPSAESLAALNTTDLVLVSGQFANAGKSTIAARLNRVNLASLTTRELRPGERQGIDKIRCSASKIALAAERGELLEFVEVRPGVVYATPATFTPEEHYVKDVELEGVLKLWRRAPRLRVIVPVPPLDLVESLRVTRWEQRGVDRDFRGGVTLAGTEDLRQRLRGAVQEVERIQQEGLVEDSRVLWVANNDLETTMQTVHRFLETGEREDPEKMKAHIERVKLFALDALGGVLSERKRLSAISS